MLHNSDIIISLSGAFLFAVTLLGVLESMEYQSDDKYIFVFLSFLVAVLYLLVSIKKDRKKQEKDT